MKTLKEAAFNLFHILVTAYALILFAGGTANLIVYAQEPRNYRIENLETRMGEIEALHLDQRLVRIETLLTDLEKESGHSWLGDLSSGGVGLLLARAVYLVIKQRDLKENS